MPRYIFVLALLLIPFIAFNQSIIDKIDSLVESKNYNANEPGINILVIKDNEEFYSKQIGFANKEKQIQINKNTLYNLASISKQFTAFCILKLEEEDKLSIKDSIQTYLPELPNLGKQINIENLLSHTSGIPDHFEIHLMQGKYSKNTTRSDFLMKYIAKTPYLSFEPGNGFAYSNTGYMLLKEIIERVSESSIEDYMNEHIFEPLEMDATTFKYLEKNGLTDETTSYRLIGNKIKRQNPVYPNAMGATGLISSLTDFAKWDNLFHNPDKRFESITAKMKEAFVLKNGSKIGYGNGLILKPYNGYLSEEHSGGWNSFLSQFRRFPELGISILISSNNYEISPFTICDEISDILVPQKKSKFKELLNEKIDLNQLKKFTGTYIDANNLVRKIKLMKDTLIITSSDTSNIIQKLSYIASYGGNIYRFKDRNNDFINFTTWKDDKVSFIWEGGTYFRFERYFKKLLNETPKIEEKWKGKYKSEVLNYKFKVKKNKKDQLILSPIFFINYPLESIGDNVFKVKNESVYIRFFKDYLTVGNAWAYNLRLDKK